MADDGPVLDLADVKLVEVRMSGLPVAEVVERALAAATLAVQALQALRAPLRALDALPPAAPRAATPLTDDEAARIELEMETENHAWTAAMHAKAAWECASEAYTRTER